MKQTSTYKDMQYSCYNESELHITKGCYSMVNVYSKIHFSEISEQDVNH